MHQFNWAMLVPLPLEAVLMGWNMRPRRIPLLGRFLTANVSLKRLVKGEDEPVSFTTKLGLWSRNSRTDRDRWTLPFGIYHLGKKRRG